MTELNDIQDYKNIEILGLEPKDRAPNDYLRMTARIFNSFKPVNPEATNTSYINGFETNSTKKNHNGEDVIEFYINKGSCFVDDQFIAFKDDVIYRVPVSKIVQNTDYYLVIYYQYSNDCSLYNPAQFKYVAKSLYDNTTMLKILEFNLKGLELETQPQKLDDLFIENYSRLFKLVSDKAKELFKINTFQGLSINKDQLYVNIENSDWDTKSGDVVFLDLDGLYKPARGCNRKIDKAFGIYVYNPENDSHTIVTDGIIDFSLQYNIDISNKILLNMEPGKSYYLLDDCSETNYAWENKQKSRAGKISSRFIPGHVKVGYALSNTKMMVNIDFSSEINTANFLELIGLPQQFQDRFNVIYAYWLNLKETDFRNYFIEQLNSLRETLSSSKDANTTASDDKNNDMLLKQNQYDNTTLDSTRTTSPTTIGTIVSPVSNTDLKTTITQGNVLAAQWQGEEQFKFSKIDYLVNYLPKFKTKLNDTINDLTTYNSYIQTIMNNFTTDNIYFRNPYKIPSFTDTFSDINGFLSLALPKLKSIGTSSASVSVYDVSTGSNTTKTYTKYNTTLDPAIGAQGEGTIVGPTESYSETNEIVDPSKDPITDFKNTANTLISILNNVIIQYTDIRDNIDDIKTSIVTFNTTDLSNFLNVDGTSGVSVYILKDNVKSYLFDYDFPKVLGQFLGIANYLKTIDYFRDNSSNDIDYNNFIEQSKQNFYNNFYIFNYIIQEMENVYNYLINRSGTAAGNTNSKTKLIDTVKVFDEERILYLSTKYNNFKTFQDSLNELSVLLKTIAEESTQIDEINNRLDSERVKIDQLSKDITTLDSAIITRIQSQKSVNSILYIDEYERKIYNYTYLTIRIRLKQKLRKSIQTDVKIVEQVLIDLKSQTIPNRDLIDRAQNNLNAFNSVLENINNELEGMVFEYNNIRTTFGINDPVELDQDDFNDYGLSDPDLECFKNLKTFS